MIQVPWLYDLTDMLGAPVIYGAGKNGTAAAKHLLDLSITPSAFIDDGAKLLDSLDGIPVCPSSALDDLPRDTPLVITPSTAFETILCNVLEAGFTNPIAGLPENPGPYPPEIPFKWDAAPDICALLVLPSDIPDRADLIRSLASFRDRAANGSLAATSATVARYQELLPDEHIAEYCEAGDEPNKIWQQPVYRLVDGISLECVNRHIDPLLPEPKHVFAQISRLDRKQPYSFFPFGSLYRDTGCGPNDPLGFRITHDIGKLASRPRQHKVVAVFGGSSTYSIFCLHHEMFTTRLEEKLQERLPHSDITVLNFGQPACACLNQLLFYTHFCHDLRPDFVISHDAHNDLHLGINSDSLLLAKYDATYFSGYQDWARIIHGQTRVTGGNWQNLPQTIVRAFHHRKIQFKYLVEAGGGRFIWGRQPLPHGKASLSPDENESLERVFDYVGGLRDSYRRVQQMYRLLDDMPPPPGTDVWDAHRYFGRFGGDDTLFIDHCHTTPLGDECIAEFYAAHLETELQTP